MSRTKGIEVASEEISSSSVETPVICEKNNVVTAEVIRRANGKLVSHRRDTVGHFIDNSKNGLLEFKFKYIGKSYEFRISSDCIKNAFGHSLKTPHKG